jgi:hypothetical protein
MKSPVETVRGRIVGYDERRGELLIRAPYSDWVTMTARQFKECLVQPMDSRPLSDKQRKACYALMGAIADYAGMSKDRTKELMKLKFLSENMEDMSERIFSLSNAPMSYVCAFQRFLVQFVLEWDIPTDFSLLDMVDDVSDYIYGCLVNKKCVICGRPADLHHIERVGMGRNRDEIIHEGMEVLPLCREHHTEAHTMPDKDFFERYHLPGGIVMDKTLCRLYGLKTKRGKGA